VYFCVRDDAMRWWLVLLFLFCSLETFFFRKKEKTRGEVKACNVGDVGTPYMKEIPSALDETPSSSNSISEQLSYLRTQFPD
jgi:hypothetical protein